MKKAFRERIKEGPIVCDGAMGTLLELYGHEERPHEIYNLKSPGLIERIHREYIDAGAEIIETNTFSGNRFRLAQFHFEDKVKEINRAAVDIARRAAGEEVYVAGAVGPLGKLLEPVGKVKHSQALDVFKEQIAVLTDAGVDVLMLETFVSLGELDIAIEAAKSLTDVPLVAQKTFPEDGAILASSFPIEVVEHLIEKQVDVVGANCTVGPQRMFSIIRSMYKDGVILSAQPAAGIPTIMDGRSVYHTTPEYLANYAKGLVESGVTIIGACCGSTPEHIRAIANVVRGLKVGKTALSLKERKAPVEPERREGEDDLRSDFAKNIGRKFLTTVELDIPRGLDMTEVISGARFCKEQGIDAVNITDGARARLRLGSIAISHRIKSEVEIEAITHLACRDRNMIGLQVEIMDAHAFGLKNLLAITGDPTNIGDYPHATSVFDVDAIGLIRAIASMNEGKDLMGNTIEQKTHFLIACAANAVADDMEKEMERLEKKVESGAQIAFTQPIYEMRTLEQFIRHTERLRIPVMLGILPLRGFKHAEFLHNEIPGMNIPARIREELRDAGEKAMEVGIRQSARFLREAKSLVAGAYLMPPFKKYRVAIDVLNEAL